MLVKKEIMYLNQNLIVETNDVDLYKELKKECGDYFTINEYTKEKDVIKLKIIKSEQLYNKYFDLVRRKRRKISKIYIDIRRDNIIIIDKLSNELCILYNQYTDEKLQYIVEIICSIFGRLLEDKGFFFINAICLSKDENGIILFCSKSIDETILLMNFMSNGFKFVSKRQLGIKKDIGIAIPIRLALDDKLFKNKNIEEKYIKQIKETRGFLNYLEENKREIKKTEKFNITAKDINRIFNEEVVQKVKIKFIIDLRQIPNINKIKISEMEKEEINQLLISNRTSSIYNPFTYVEELFDKKQTNHICRSFVDSDIKGYRIFQSDINVKEIIKFIMKAK